MKIKYETIDFSEMKPDMYDGPNSDEMKPRWVTSVEKEGEVEIGDIITLNSHTFPTGTRVLIQVPVCPQCETYTADQMDENKKCFECGFDWGKWAIDNYS